MHWHQLCSPYLKTWGGRGGGGKVDTGKNTSIVLGNHTRADFPTDLRVVIPHAYEMPRRKNM